MVRKECNALIHQFMLIKKIEMTMKKDKKEITYQDLLDQ